MNIMRVTYFALVAFAFAVSCSKEAAEPDVYEWIRGGIRIKPTLSDVSSTRAQSMTLPNLNSFQVSCFNTGDYNEKSADKLPPYFEDINFIKSDDGLTFYSNSPNQIDWPVDSVLGVIRFYAFSPSRNEMANKNTTEFKDGNWEHFFKLNHSVESINGKRNIGYRLDRIRVNPDISKQDDFITADVSGDRYNDFGSSVELAFRHQMSQVEIRAWGASTSYNIEIAGVRLGNPTVENSYIFSEASSPEKGGEWSDSEETAKGKVQYVYRNTNTTGGGPGSGDRIYYIRKNEHDTEQSAASIMGIGGNAMVIPGANKKWEGLDDPNIRNTPYTTDKMYISVLLRVTDPVTGSQRYPYTGNQDGMEVMTYAVDKNGIIVYRLYPGAKKGEYFTDQWYSNRYTPNAGMDIQEFGWAAVPVDIDWKTGKRYVYTLDYTEGVGLHDPSDSEPGKPIGGLTNIEWSVNVGNWDYAVKNDDYEPDVDVPGMPDI